MFSFSFQVYLGRNRDSCERQEAIAYEDVNEAMIYAVSALTSAPHKKQFYIWLCIGLRMRYPQICM